jgi:hypothetical protein
MSEHDDGGRSVVSSKTVDLGVAALFFAFGALVAFDSSRIGARWADDGPQSGYFPFYIGVIICISSLVNFVLALRSKAYYGRSFVSVEQLKAVFSVAIPTLVYVLAIQFLGIYVASTVFIAGFMVWLGKYGWIKAASVSVGVSVVFFLMFETWFKVQLPKGPLEALLGLN